MGLRMLLILGTHVQEGYCSCLCVCVSAKSHLTYGTSVHPENTVTYSAGITVQKICGFFQHALLLKAIHTVGHFLWKAHMHIIVPHVEYLILVAYMEMLTVSKYPCKGLLRHLSQTGPRCNCYMA